MSMAPRVALALPLLVGNVAAHGSLFYPPPRQSFDRHVSAILAQSWRILASFGAILVQFCAIIR